jgi:rSAM/selenodomain-associated transferase 1
MEKASAPGRAKTRLVPPLSFEQAAALNTAFLQDVADNLVLAGEQASGKNVSIVGYAAYGPPGSSDFFRRILPAAIDLVEAWLPNFGDCLFHTIGEILSRGHRSAVVLNSDSPTLPTALLTETAEVLARPGDRAVLGPSIDGGYYLLGLKAPHRRLFEDITWSTALVAEQTLARAQEIGLAVHILPAWYDVDDVESLNRLAAEFSFPSPLVGEVREGGREVTPRTPAHRLSIPTPNPSPTSMHSGAQQRGPGGGEEHDGLLHPRYAAHTAELIRQLARDRDSGRSAARAFAAASIHA